MTSVYLNESLDDLFICVPTLLSAEEEQDVIRKALKENPQNSQRSSGLLPNDSKAIFSTKLNLQDDTNLALAVNISKNWKPGRTIRIRFLEGEKELQNKVRKFAQTWLQFANLKFDWVADDAPKAEIRISFKRNLGSKSAVGTDCLAPRYRDQSVSTMNLALTPEMSDDDIRRATLHEFGHALGAIHEHQSPAGGIKWNTKRVYEDCAGPPNYWSKETTDRNIINPVNLEVEKGNFVWTKFDLLSIMIYPLKASWVLNNDGKSLPKTLKLSEKDKALVQEVYPADPAKVGQFSTLVKRSWEKRDREPALSDIAFEPAYTKPPQLALGLTWIDLDARRPISVKATANDITGEYFQVSIDSEPASRVFSATCSWLQISPNATDVYVGQFDIASAWTNGIPKKKTSTTIKFPERFYSDGPPIVVCWITSFSMDHGCPWSLKTYPTGVTPIRFTLNVDAGQETELRGAQISWVAFSQRKEGMVGGTFSTGETVSKQNAGHVDFDQGAFPSPPQLMMALSGFDYESGHNLRLRLSHSDVTKDGFNWHLDSWLDSVMKSATASYVAIHPPNAADDVVDLGANSAVDGATPMKQDPKTK